ncbi:MAG: tetratricopeptide repeat protein [Candidatus Eiseniibacteriota bacterium]
MDTVRWERMQDLFHRATELPTGGQRSFLEGECGGDGVLLADVLGMLEEDARETLVDSELGAVARRVLADGPEVPTRDFGPYRPVRLLGEGGMGVVFLAERADLGSVVALKILRDAWLSPARRERFESEQRMLAQIDHPSIARLLDAGALADGTPWIAMEYVDGVPLTEHCEARRCPVEERLRLFRDVCEAVRHAHRHAIIHRDLKPSNILVRTDGTIKLLDFGIAKSLDSLQGDADRTRTAWRLVTPAYAAPEQVTGGPLGVYTDVWALGVILHQLLTGSLPAGQPPSAAARAPGMPRSPGRSAWADLDVLCLTALREDPQRRYATVDAFIRDVDHYLAGEPLEARPDSLGYRTAKFVRRHRAALAVTAAVFAAVVVLVAFYGARLAGARNAAVAEAERAQRIQRFMLSLFEGGEEEAAPPDSLRVVTLLDRGLAEARMLDADPVAQSELFQTLGEIQTQLGRFEQADSLLVAALDGRRALLGNEHPDVARAMVALGLVRTARAEYDDAERLVREGLEITRRTLPRAHPDIASALVALGEVLVSRGQYDDAIAVLEEALSLRDADAPEDLDLAMAFHELANVHFYAGHYVASDSLNQRVLDISRRVLGERHPSLADNLINLGAVRSQLGRHDEAERWFREALDLTRSWYGDDHPKAATNRTMLARALVSQGRLDEAVVELEQALLVLERALGPIHPRVASALNELGRVALQRGDLDDAEKHFRRMVEIYRAVHGEEHDVLGVALSNLASVHMAREEWSRAEELLREVTALFSRTLSENHLNVAIARIKLGRTLLRQGRGAEAAKETGTGHNILVALGDSTSSWVVAARQDLAEIGELGG